MSLEMLSVLNTLFGIAILSVFFGWVASSKNPTYYAVLIAFSGYLAAVGSYKIIPTMGTFVLGGSLYLPFALLLLGLAAEMFSYARARALLSGVLVGLIFFMVGNFRWVIFEYITAIPENGREETLQRAEYIFVTIVMFYFAGLFMLLFQRCHKWHPADRIIVPVIATTVICTGLNFVVTMHTNEDYYKAIGLYDLFVSTLCLRLALPLVAYTYLRYSWRVKLR